MNLFKQSQDLSPSQTAQDELETQQTQIQQISYHLLACAAFELFYRSSTFKYVGACYCSYDSVTDLCSIEFKKSLCPLLLKNLQ